MGDLERIAPTPRKITVAGETIEVSPLRVRDLPAFLRDCEPLVAAIAAGDLRSALMHHADALITVTAIGAGVDRAWLEEQTPDVLIDLAAQVVEANVDFFVRSILPRIQDAALRVTAAIDGGTAG